MPGPSASSPDEDRSNGDHDLRDFVLRQFFSRDGLMFVVLDPDGVVVEANDAITTGLGHQRDDIVGRPFDELITGFDGADPDELATALRDERRADAVLQVACADGVERHVQWSIEQDDATGFHFGIGRDITDERRLTQDLRRLAYTDALTGLANRARLADLLDAALAAGDRPAVLFCDLDRFKIVNDSLGHAAGDELLRLLGRRLEATLGSAGAVAARLGGDEFVVMLRNASIEQATEVAERVRRTVTDGFQIDGRRVTIGVSIGIALARGRSHETADHLIGEADTAAYEAKESRKGGVVVHDLELQRRLDRRFEVEAGLASALADDRFIVHYQPIVRLPGAGIVGAEALVRWRDEFGNLVLPGEFITVAEDAGLLDEIGDRVLFQATKDIASIAADGRRLHLSVNATAGQISDPSFTDRVLSALSLAEMAPHDLTIEVTESAILDDQVRSIATMQALREAGVTIAIDDFGTGYSSLSYLHQLPIDVVKIDRSFVQRISDDPVSVAVVRAVVELCRALDLHLVVEGIETTDQAAMVEQLGCDIAQGFLFHRALPIDGLTQRVTGRLPSRSDAPR